MDHGVIYTGCVRYFLSLLFITIIAGRYLVLWSLFRCHKFIRCLFSSSTGSSISYVVYIMVSAFLL